MAKWKTGDRVEIVTREVTEDDRKNNVYYTHMAGIRGTVQYLHEGDMVSIKADTSTLPKVSSDIHQDATDRMRGKINDEQKKSLEPDEINFNVNFCLIVKSVDLQPLKA